MKYFAMCIDGRRGKELRRERVAEKEADGRERRANMALRQTPQTIDG
jgi:hypothetical protein